MDNKPLIIVVDDTPDNTFLLSGILEENNYEPLIAGSAKECFDILKNQEPELILMDIMMPEMTGVEALDMLQLKPEYKNIPVIMVTAKTDSKDVEDALERGAVDYVKKPIDEIELLARIKATLRLSDSENKLRHMLKAHESFIRMVSHDLRSPFTTIHGFAELLLADDNLSDSQKDALQYIIESTNHSLDYFNKLLDWSRMGASDLNLTRKEFGIGPMLEYTATLFLTKSREKNLNLLLEIKDDFTVLADDIYLSQAVNNLVNNSIKFTPENGEVRITSLIENNTPIIRIRDNGVGMPESMVNNIFSDSIKSSRKGTKGEKGTGIGLTICKKIIDAHGYMIICTSQVNQFTEFNIICKPAT